MSYILDALQRAEAERERGRVPGLKSQLVPPPRAERPARSGWRPRYALPVLAALVALVALALGVWWWAGRSDTAPTVVVDVPSANPPTVEPPAPAATPSAPPIPVSAPERLAAPSLPILAPPRPPPVPPKAVASATAPSQAAPSAPSATAAVPAPAPATTATQNAAADAAKPPSPAVASAAVPGFGELSPEARAQLPPVSISGSTYSKNPALRMLIANGKVVYEGQDIAPGLRLETIGARSAVLNHQGLRYSIGY